jgi:hypothetical protein
MNDRARVLQACFSPGAGGARRERSWLMPADWQPGPVAMRPLPADVQQPLESALGASLAGVRVGVGAAARQAGAEAFTIGESIYFAPGQFAPGSARGFRLLAHEVAHVLQQRRGQVRNPFGHGVAVIRDPSLEAEAERLAVRAAAVQPKGPVGKGPAWVPPNKAHGGVAQAMIVPVLSEKQQQVITAGSRLAKSYVAQLDDLKPLKEVMKAWKGQVPSLKQFQENTYVYFASRSSDPAVVQMDFLLVRFHNPSSDEDQAACARHLVLACNFWLRKVNVKPTSKLPLDYKNLGKLGKSAKLSGYDQRRAGILALSTVLIGWLAEKRQPSTLGSIVESMSRVNRGVHSGHGYADIDKWNKKHATRIPESIKTKTLRESRDENWNPDIYLVSLDDDSQKRVAKLVFRGGKAYRWLSFHEDKGFTLFDTGNGGAHFVMDKQGRIYAGTLTDSPHFVHASLVGWADALSAGFIYATQGVVTKIKNDSGHYHPRAQEMVNALLRLQLYGVDLGKVEVERMGNTHPKGAKTFAAIDMLEAEHGDWPDEWENLGPLF